MTAERWLCVTSAVHSYRYITIVLDVTVGPHIQVSEVTGLAPEVTLFGGTDDMVPGPRHNMLRPETMEALFVLWRTTHDPIYREWGWAIFQAFEKHCRVRSLGVTEEPCSPSTHVIILSSTNRCSSVGPLAKGYHTLGSTCSCNFALLTDSGVVQRSPCDVVSVYATGVNLARVKICG